MKDIIANNGSGQFAVSGIISMIGAIFVLVAALIALNAAKSELIKDDNGEYKHPLAGVIVSGVLYLVGYFMLIIFVIDSPCREFYPMIF